MAGNFLQEISEITNIYIIKVFGRSIKIMCEKYRFMCEIFEPITYLKIIIYILCKYWFLRILL